MKANPRTIRRALLAASLAVCAVPWTVAGQDAVVARGVAQYRAGDVAGAAGTLTKLLQSDAALDADDRLRANTYLALALVERGDIGAAQRYAFAAVDQEPCLELSVEGASPEALDLFEQMRPGAGWCSIGPRSTMAVAAVAPGLTHALTGSRLHGLAYFAGAVGGVASGLMLMSSSDDTYARYRNAASPMAAQALFDSAQKKHVAGIAALTIGVGVWAWNVVDARRIGVQRRARIESVRGYALDFGAMPDGAIAAVMRVRLGDMR